MRTIREFIRRHKYTYLVLYVPVYLLMFSAVERLVPTTGYWVSYIPWDDAIPFCEYFAVFYCMWYVLLFTVGLYLLFQDEYNFRLFMYGIMIGFTACLVFCLLFPNGQDLRPAVFERRNFCTWLLGLIYHADTNTNVMPSMHVIGAMMCCFAVFHSEKLGRRGMRAGVILLTLLINVSTVFVKQHSLLDVFVGLGVSLLLYAAVYVVIAPSIRPQYERIKEVPDSAAPACRLDEGAFHE